MIEYTVIESPIGGLTATTDGEFVLGLYMDNQRHGPGIAEDWQRAKDVGVLSLLREELAAYFQGELREFGVPLRLVGTEFQRRVWGELTRIPYAETISYGELAKRLGQAGASRAVGLANGRNPISIVVPCHRVIGASGDLTGYGGGLGRKAALLAFERETSMFGPHAMVCEPEFVL